MAEQTEQKKYDYDILVTTDFQGDFVTGVLKNDAALAVEDAVVAEIDAHEGILVDTRDTHDKETYAQSVEGQLLPMHCVRGTEGWQNTPKVQAALDRKKNVIYIDKTNFGFIDWPKALFGIENATQEQIMKMFAGKKIRIRIIGTCTDICNMSAFVILRAWFPMAEMEMVDGACAASFEDKNTKTRDAAYVIVNSLLGKVVPTIYKGK